MNAGVEGSHAHCEHNSHEHIIDWAAECVPEEAGRGVRLEDGPDAEGGEFSRSIGLLQLTLFGVRATIGTGIFIILTEAVPEAGPGVIVSFGTYLLDIVLDVLQLGGVAGMGDREMPGSEPLEIRPSEEVEGWLERENRRTKVPKGTLLEALAEESIRARRFLGTGFRSRNIQGGRGGSAQASTSGRCGASPNVLLGSFREGCQDEEREAMRYKKGPRRSSPGPQRSLRKGPR